jgi:hypothetical protein
MIKFLKFLRFFVLLLVCSFFFINSWANDRFFEKSDPDGEYDDEIDNQDNSLESFLNQYKSSKKSLKLDDKNVSQKESEDLIQINDSNDEYSDNLKNLQEILKGFSNEDSSSKNEMKNEKKNDNSLEKFPDSFENSEFNSEVIKENEINNEAEENIFKDLDPVKQIKKKTREEENKIEVRKNDNSDLFKDFDLPLKKKDLPENKLEDKFNDQSKKQELDEKKNQFLKDLSGDPEKVKNENQKLDSENPLNLFDSNKKKDSLDVKNQDDQNKINLDEDQFEKKDQNLSKKSQIEILDDNLKKENNNIKLPDIKIPDLKIVAPTKSGDQKKEKNDLSLDDLKFQEKKENDQEQKISSEKIEIKKDLEDELPDIFNQNLKDQKEDGEGAFEQFDENQKISKKNDVLDQAEKKVNEKIESKTLKKDQNQKKETKKIESEISKNDQVVKKEKIPEKKIEKTEIKKTEKREIKKPENEFSQQNLVKNSNDLKVQKEKINISKGDFEEKKVQKEKVLIKKNELPHVVNEENINFSAKQTKKRIEDNDDDDESNEIDCFSCEDSYYNQENLRSSEYTDCLFEYNKGSSSYLSAYKFSGDTPEFLISKKENENGNRHLNPLYFRDDYIKGFFDAIEAENLSAIERFFSYFQTEYIVDSNKDNPLIFAIKRKRNNVVRFLLKRGFDFKMTDFCGVTPIEIAHKYRNLEALEILKSLYNESNEVRR